MIEVGYDIMYPNGNDDGECSDTQPWDRGWAYK